MKKLILIVGLTMAFFSAGAQNCESIVLPFFGYDTARMEDYPVEKLMHRCWYSQASFYESDTIPAGVDVFSISQVRGIYDNTFLPENYVVDLTTLSYYAYNFRQFQMQYPRGNVTICFTTPSSTHPYLVLRSIEDSFRIAAEYEETYYNENGRD